MVPIPIVWTQYTLTLQGRVLKLVPCENCTTEYVYVLEREGEGTGTSLYLVNEDGARDHAASAAEDTLQQYLANDFDPVPCPVCGHYQRYMFAKLYDGGSAWVQIGKLVAIVVVCLSTIGMAYWAVTYFQWRGEHALVRLALTAALLALCGLLTFGLGAIERSQARRFDPNTEVQRVRIEKARCRAVTRAQFEELQRGQAAGTADNEARVDPE